MYKNFYINTKKSDINITLSASKSNYSAWGIDRDKHGFQIHLGKCHIHFTKYGHEQAN